MDHAKLLRREEKCRCNEFGPFSFASLCLCVAYFLGVGRGAKKTFPLTMIGMVRAFEAEKHQFHEFNN
jgi:hypothetical protein